MVVFGISNRGYGRRPKDKDWDKRDACPGGYLLLIEPMVGVVRSAVVGCGLSLTIFTSWSHRISLASTPFLPVVPSKF
ncbi:MAG: hypothetical protein WD491_03705 [Balneolales bacterium]